MTIPVKKLIIMNILDILRRYSDEDHRLSQKDIVDILKTEYNMGGESFKTARRLLLKPHSGSTAFQDQAMEERWKAKRATHPTSAPENGAEETA